MEYGEFLFSQIYGHARSHLFIINCNCHIYGFRVPEMILIIFDAAIAILAPKIQKIYI